MPRTRVAIVTPEVLRWARERVNMPLSAAAKKASVTPAKLASWELGEAQPTVRQARLLAHSYRLPLAAFYLDAAPVIPIHAPKDYRRLAGTQQEGLDASLALDIKDATEKREIALELLAAEGAELPVFEVPIDLDDDPEDVGATLRAKLGVSMQEQSQWRDPRRAFNTWRARAEQGGVFVLQTSSVPLESLRAYSLFYPHLPVVVVNRKDAPAGRSFSLLHELVHLGLNSEGLCDLSTAVERPPEEQKLEVFCNAAAAAALIPRADLLDHSVVASHRTAHIWEDREIVTLARYFSTSREALLRRLLTFQHTTEAFYRQKRAQYQEEYARQPRQRGQVRPSVDTLSLLGRPFVRLVLEGLDSGHITTTDVSDYLDLKLKHLPELTAALVGD